MTVDGEPVAAGKQQILLAVLLCQANRPVRADVLAEAAWPLTPPSPGTFRWHLHRLRATVGDRLIRRDSGYLLRAHEGELDAERFADLVRRAGAEPAEQALVLLDRALLLWRGAPYGGLPDPEEVGAEAARLQELRLQAVEARARAMMALGRSAECAGDLAAAAAAHPLRESLAELRLRALAAAGRRGEALRLFGQTRRRLREELGVEPGGALRRLHEELLRPDPAPRLLPPDVHAFTGRAEELAALDRLLAGPPGIAVVSGVGGVGKSGLALHWAHRAQDRFPDGHLYADLGEQTPAEVLHRFLAALGAAIIPEDHDARAALYRQMLARRRILVVLDNASGSAQVRALLPGAPGSVTVITGRSRFEHLVAEAGALPIRLDVLPPADAALLIGRIARIDPARASPLAELCARHPLALRVAGARLLTRPGWTAETLAVRLAGERRLDELRAGELDVRATLEAGYRCLPETERTLFERLGLLQAPSFTAWMAATVMDVPVGEGGDLLERLAERQLLQPDGVDGAGQERYRFHDLVRLLARERAGAGPSQDAALKRFLRCLLTLAKDAYLREYQGGFRLLHSDSPPWQPRGEILPEDPMTWLAAEHATLLAAIRQAADLGLAEICWDLALTGVRLFEIHGQFADWQQTSLLALRACREHGEERGVTAMLVSLGSVAAVQRHHTRAVALLNRALPQLEDGPFKALALSNLASAEIALGRLEPGLAKLAEARSIASRAGDAVVEAILLTHLALRDRGDPDPLLHRAAALAAVNRRVSLMVMLSSTRATLRAGRYARAEEVSRRLIDDLRLIGDPVLERRALCLRAESLTALNRPAEATACLRRAHELALAQHALPEADRIAGLLTAGPNARPTDSQQRGPSVLGDHGFSVAIRLASPK